MSLSTDVVMRACERVFARLCKVGATVPPDTPAACFVAAAARHVDDAQRLLPGATDADDLGAVLRHLAKASSLLGDVSRLSDQQVEGLERVSVIVDGLCVTLEIDQREAAARKPPPW